jgi:hypothetical protein
MVANDRRTTLTERKRDCLRRYRPTPAAGCSNCFGKELTCAIHWNRWIYVYPLYGAALPAEIELFGVPLDPRSVRDSGKDREAGVELNARLTALQHERKAAYAHFQRLLAAPPNSD